MSAIASTSIDAEAKNAPTSGRLFSSSSFGHVLLIASPLGKPPFAVTTR